MRNAFRVVAIVRPKRGRLGEVEAIVEASSESRARRLMLEEAWSRGYTIVRFKCIEHGRMPA
jgi:hypothetical protein